MWKSELIIQLFIIFLVSGIISFWSIKFYPHRQIPARNNLSNITITDQVNAAEEVTDGDVVENLQFSPNRIVIPRLGLDLAVTEGAIFNNQWSLYDDKISWLRTSSEPGKGNVILYGHNLPNLFGSLVNTKIGDVITLEHLGKVYTYAITEIKRVHPKETNAIMSADDRLTLYTCDGAFDQKRLVVIATADVK